MGPGGRKDEEDETGEQGARTPHDLGALPSLTLWETLTFAQIQGEKETL